MAGWGGNIAELAGNSPRAQLSEGVCRTIIPSMSALVSLATLPYADIDIMAPEQETTLCAVNTQPMRSAHTSCPGI